MRLLCFDMDGTIAGLYKVEGWLEGIESEQIFPFEKAAPMWDMTALSLVLQKLQSQGWEIHVITWLAKNSSVSYKTAVRKAKLKWLERHNFTYDHFHGVAYGSTKADSVRKRANGDIAILIDDNEKVRNGWHLGPTVNPQAVDIVDFLSRLF